MVDGCLSLEQIERLAALGDEPRAAAAATHLSECDSCRSALSQARCDSALFGELLSVAADDRSMAESVSSAALPSDAIAGYRLLGWLHGGGQGEVYLAQQEGTGVRVAIKVQHPVPASASRQRERFEQGD